MRYPRLLIFGEGFSDVSGPGLTLSSLFNGWPREKIVDAHYTPSRVNDVTNNHIYLPSRGITGLWRQSRPQSPIVSSNLLAKSSITGSTHKGISLLLKRLIRDYALLHKRGMADVMNQFKCYKPEVLYVQPSFGSSISILKLHDFLGNIPMAMHVMDDWVGKWSLASSRLERILFKKESNAFVEIVRRSKGRFAICDAMASEYAQRYGYTFSSYQRLIDTSKLLQSKTLLPKADKIIYIGTVSICIIETLRMVARAVEKINSNSATLDFSIVTAQKNMIHSAGLSQYLDKNAPYPNIEIPAVMQAASILLLPLGFTEECFNYARLSMPSKVPEYLFSGIPCLVLAPKETAVSQYASKYNWGTTIGENKLELVVNALERLIYDIEYRNTLIDNSMKTFNEFHDSKLIRAKFQNEILHLI